MSKGLKDSQHELQGQGVRRIGEGSLGASGPQLRSFSLSQRKALSKRVTDEIFIFTLLDFTKEWIGERQHITSNYLLITLLQVCECLEVEQGIMAANNREPSPTPVKDD